MARLKKSKIWLISKQELQYLLDNSNSIVEILKKLDYNGYNGNYKTLLNRIREDNLCLQKFNINKQLFRKNFLHRIRKKTPSEELFSNNNKFVSGKILKKRLISEGVKYECANCKNTGLWLNVKLSLQVDHINGINTDNQINNLRFLCPNCHSQTNTFSGKRNKRIFLCESCGDTISRNAKKCIKCESLKRRPIIYPSNEEMIKICIDNKYNYSKIGRILGVSSTTIKKHLIRNNLELKKRRPTQIHTEIVSLEGI